MLHTDEGVLHSYLDGALRTDERLGVESHIAACASCAAALQEARQLKSQATKILSRAQPPALARPPRSMPDRRRKRPFIPVAWAASIALALAAGWTAQTILRQPPVGPIGPAISVERNADAPGGLLDEVAAGKLDSTAGLATSLLQAEGAAAEEEAQATPPAARQAAPAVTPPAVQQARRRSATPPAETPAQAAKAAAEPPAVTQRLLVEQQARDQTAVRADEGQREQVRNEARVGAAASPTATGRGVPAAPAVRPDYAVPLVEVLPGYLVVAVSTTADPLLVVTQLSAAGDTLVLVYEAIDRETTDRPFDNRRIFDQGMVLERDSTGQSFSVIGRYRTVGYYRITARATPGISRDSLATLLGLLEVRELR